MTTGSCGWSKAHVTETDHMLYLKLRLIYRYFFLIQVRAWMMNKWQEIHPHDNNYHIVVIQTLDYYTNIIIIKRIHWFVVIYYINIMVVCIMYLYNMRQACVWGRSLWIIFFVTYIIVKKKKQKYGNFSDFYSVVRDFTWDVV